MMLYNSDPQSLNAERFRRHHFIIHECILTYQQRDADEDGGQIFVDGAVRGLEDLDSVLHDYVDPGKLQRGKNQ